MSHRYRLTLEPLEAGPGLGAAPVTLEFESHDDLVALLARAGARADLGPADARELVIGLKLFTGVMLRNRALPMFRDLAPHVGAFMKALKGGGRGG